jgi:hypothetical protein
MGHFGNKNAKWVKLPQFESLLGLSTTLETLEAKVKIGGYFMRVKCNFPYILLLIFIFVSFYFNKNFVHHPNYIQHRLPLSLITFLKLCLINRTFKFFFLKKSFFWAKASFLDH